MILPTVSGAKAFSTQSGADSSGLSSGLSLSYYIGAGALACVLLSWLFYAWKRRSVKQRRESTLATENRLTTALLLKSEGEGFRGSGSGSIGSDKVGRGGKNSKVSKGSKGRKTKEGEVVDFPSFTVVNPIFKGFPTKAPMGAATAAASADPETLRQYFKAPQQTWTLPHSSPPHTPSSPTTPTSLFSSPVSPTTTSTTTTKRSPTSSSTKRSGWGGGPELSPERVWLEGEEEAEFYDATLNPTSSLFLDSHLGFGEREEGEEGEEEEECEEESTGGDEERREGGGDVLLGVRKESWGEEDSSALSIERGLLLREWGGEREEEGEEEGSSDVECFTAEGGVGNLSGEDFLEETTTESPPYSHVPFLPPAPSLKKLLYWAEEGATPLKHLAEGAAAAGGFLGSFLKRPLLFQQQQQHPGKVRQCLSPPLFT